MAAAVRNRGQDATPTNPTSLEAKLESDNHQPIGQSVEQSMGGAEADTVAQQLETMRRGARDRQATNPSINQWSRGGHCKSRAGNHEARDERKRETERVRASEQCFSTRQALTRLS
eukprot:6182002-Heterocapsa_arctica.AAC.1